MPEPSGNGASGILLRDIFALLFAVVCGVLLGIAAAPIVLPKLGFAGFSQYVEPRTAAHAPSTSAQANRAAPIRPSTSPVTPQPRISQNRVPIARQSSRKLAVNGAISKANARPEYATPPIPWFEINSLFGLALLVLAFVLWLRRDLFAAMLCRWAKDPRGWRGKAEAGIVNARCVLYFEGNAYRLGAEFFTQSVEVRYTPLFLRINVRGSDRALVVPRRLPHVAAGLLKRRASAS